MGSSREGAGESGLQIVRDILGVRRFAYECPLLCDRWRNSLAGRPGVVSSCEECHDGFAYVDTMSKLRQSISIRGRRMAGKCKHEK